MEGPDSWFLGIDTILAQQEAHQVNNLFALLQSFVLTEGEDMLSWNDDSETFTVSSCYRKLLETRLFFFNLRVFNFEWKLVWDRATPSNVSFLVWLVVRDRVLTHKNLHKRGFKLASNCLFCRCAEEDIVPLFLYCPFIQSLWCYFCSDFVHRLSPHVSLGDRLKEWDPMSHTEQGAYLRLLLPHALVWIIWNECNNICFEEKSQILEKFISIVKECVWGWSSDKPIMKDLRLDKVIFDWDRL